MPSLTIADKNIWRCMIGARDRETNRRLVQEITYGDQLLAIIVSANFQEPGIHFFTPNHLSQQLAYMRHPRGKIIQPHVHNAVSREVHFTQEVLIVKQGKVCVDFYTEEQEYLESHLLQTGDVILLIQGGHGFKMLEETEMIEVKQGPYVGEQDKTRFIPQVINSPQIKVMAEDLEF
jgi:mannose-6-phosphate isomerase-like protein (cupin superfamily)